MMRLVVAVATVVAVGCSRPAAEPAAGGRTAPPALRYEQHIFAGGAAPPGGDPTNPFAEDSRSAAEGGKLFASMNCNGCHGNAGEGGWAPSLADGRWHYGGSDGAIFQTIFYGRPQGMPAFGGLLQAELIWKLVTFLRSLPPPAAVPTQAW